MRPAGAWKCSAGGASNGCRRRGRCSTAVPARRTGSRMASLHITHLNVATFIYEHYLRFFF